MLGDAMATHDPWVRNGTHIPAEVMHGTALASLHGEFAEVMDTAEAVARLDRVTARR